MTNSKNDPINLELPAYLVDMLANWARADAKVMRPGDDLDWQATYDKRLRLADGLVGSLLSHLSRLPDLAGAGDLADALKERREAYDAYNAAKSQ